MASLLQNKKQQLGPQVIKNWCWVITLAIEKKAKFFLKFFETKV